MLGQTLAVVGIVAAITEIRHTETYKRYKDIYYRYAVRKQIKALFLEIFKVNNICIVDNKLISYPKIRSILFNDYGFKVALDISLICTSKDITNIEQFIKATFKAYAVEIEEVEGYIYVSVYREKLEDIEHKKVPLSNTTLLLGYNYKGNIAVDMSVTPHLLICGLSKSGKTQMSKTIINNLDGADVVLLNAFKDDFKAHRGEFIVGEDNILEFLKSCLETKIERCRPIYIVIDELLVLSKNKDISKCITDLLAVARHYNIYLICISQIGTKEQLKFKDLFNCRICFRAIESSAYHTVLGCSAEGGLQQREFYLYADSLVKGKTFINSN